MKKIKNLICLLFVCVLFSLFFACTEEKKTVELVDFENQSHTVNLGEMYTIDLTSVRDKNGNTYRVLYEVKTKSGGSVSVLENVFDITDVEGYVITYTVHVDKKTTFTKTDTLQVVDLGSPSIRINKPSEGVVDVLYTLPAISVADLSGNITSKEVRVYFVDGESLTEVALTETGDGYTFTPDKPGNYRISVTATDGSSNTATATIDFFVGDTILEGEVIHFANYSSATQYAFNKPVTAEIVDDDEYGKVLSVKHTSSEWVNMSITPRLPLSDYEKFDFVEFYVYLDALDDSQVNLSLFNEVEYRETFKADTWYKVSIPMEVFLSKMSNANQIFIPVNFNSVTSENHKELVELKISNIMAKYSAAFQVECDAPNIMSGETTEVTFTVSSRYEVVPEFKLEVVNADTKEVQTVKSVEGNVIKYDLVKGSYTYKIVSDNDLYIGEVNGEFIVDTATKIELPVVPTDVVAGAEFIIPDAKVTVNGVETSNVPQKDVTFISKYTNKEEVVSGNSFTPSNSGVIVLTYTYEGAVAKTLQINVTRKAVSQTFALDMTNSDVLGDLQVAANNVVTYVPATATQESYISWSIKDNAKITWQMFRLQSTVSTDILAEYDYVTIRVKAVSPNGTYRWRVLSCSDKFLVGAAAPNYQDENRLSLNEWHELHIPMSAFLEGGNGLTKKFLSVTFNSSKDGNADNVQEVQIAGFELKKKAEFTLSMDKSAFTNDEKIVVNVATQSSIDYKVNVMNGNEVVKSFDKTADGVYEWSDLAKATGEYTVKIVGLTKGYVVSQNDVEFKIASYEIKLGNYNENVFVGDTIDLDLAKVYCGDQATDETVTRNAKYTYVYNNEKIEVTEDTFTPDLSGRLLITYSYEGANDASVEIIVQKKLSETTLLNIDSPDSVVGHIISSGTSLSYVAKTDSERAYLSWTATGMTSWSAFAFTPEMSETDIAKYDYVRVYLYAKSSTAGTFKAFVASDLANTAKLPKNEWVYVDVKISSFLMGYKAKFLNISFNSTAANFAQVSELRIGGIEARTFDETTNTLDNKFIDMSADCSSNFVSTAANAVVTYNAGNPEDTVYTGGYISWKASVTSSFWANLKINSTFDLNALNLTDYEYVSVWLNMTSTADYGNISLYNSKDVENGVPNKISLETNKWVQVKISLQTFILKQYGVIKPGYWMSINFNKATSMNHKGVTEVKIGQITFEKFDTSVKVEEGKLNVSGSNLSNVEIYDANNKKVDYTFVKNAQGLYTIEGLAAGNYKVVVTNSVDFYNYNDSCNAFGPVVTKSFKKTYSIAIV